MLGAQYDAALRGPAESSPMRRGLKGSPAAPGHPARRARRIFPDEEGTESLEDVLDAGRRRIPQNLPR